MVYNQFMADFAIRLGLCYNLASQFGVKEVKHDENNTSEKE